MKNDQEGQVLGLRPNQQGLLKFSTIMKTKVAISMEVTATRGSEDMEWTLLGPVNQSKYQGKIEPPSEFRHHRAGGVGVGRIQEKEPISHSSQPLLP